MTRESGEVKKKGEMAHLAGWNFKDTLTIPAALVGAVGAPHLNYPVPIKCVNSAHIGANAKADGGDIRFTAINGTTLLEYEQLSFAVAGGLANGLWFVKVPSVAADAATSFCIQYGNADAVSAASPEDVWDANYVGVWHLEEAVASGFADSTANANNGTGTGVTGQDAGKIGYGVEFDTAADRITCGSGASLDNIRLLTVEAWFLPDTEGIGTSYGSLVNKDASNCWHVSMNGNTSMRIFQNRATTTGIWTWSVTQGQWQHLALTYSSQSVDSDPVVLVNGSAKTVTETNTPVGDPANDAANSLWIGNSSGTARTWDGKIDEVRISNIIRSAGWLITSYNLENSPIQPAGTPVAEMAQRAMHYRKLSMR